MRHNRNISTVAIGWRIGLSMLITLFIVGTIGYLYASEHLERVQITAYANNQKLDVRSLQNASANDAQNNSGVLEQTQALKAIAGRSVVSKAQVVKSGGVIVLAEDPFIAGQRNKDPDIQAAIDAGEVTEESTEDEASGDDIFKFVSPVLLDGRRDALFVTYNTSISDQRLSDVRLTLILTGLLTLLVGAFIFHLVAGRWLMRDHRFALSRASLDGLTGLANQRSFAVDLGRVTSASERIGDLYSLVMIDIDDFRTVNDEEGRTAGDRMLTEVAEILEKQGLSDVPYRLGDDDFALLMPGSHYDAAVLLAEDLVTKLRQRGIRASIGVSTMRLGVRGEVVEAEAAAALKEARRRGGGNFVHFEELRGEVNVAQPDKIEAVRHLIAEEGLTTAFQPIWNFETRSVMGYEALTRPDPRYGLNGPAEAFDVAEQMGQVHRLDEICVRNAFLTSGGISPDRLLFVNLSPQTLDIDAGDGDWLLETSLVSRRPRGQIVIEVTERFGGRMLPVMKRLQTLKDEGFKIALDDIGTGNSGLEMMGRIDADFIKIDRSIVNGAEKQASARAVLTAMALFAEQTGTFVIAEGIEDAEMLQYVQSLAEPELGIPTVVHGGQGYGLGRPSVEVPLDPVWPLD